MSNVMRDFIDEIKTLNIGAVKENEPLLKHTTIKIGGPADVLIEPSSIASLRKNDGTHSEI